MPHAAKRKPGRPPTGKKGYCLRMLPGTHTKLTQAAKAAGFDGLGDWLDQSPLLFTFATEATDDWDEIPFDDLLREFQYRTAQAMKALAGMHDIIDYSPKLAHDPGTVQALAELRRKHAALQELARGI